MIQGSGQLTESVPSRGPRAPSGRVPGGWREPEGTLGGQLECSLSEARKGQRQGIESGKAVRAAGQRQRAYVRRRGLEEFRRASGLIKSQAL